jgi:hypothetical protein
MKAPQQAREFELACKKYSPSLKAELKPAEAIDTLQSALSSIAQWLVGDAPVAEGFRSWLSLARLRAEVCPQETPNAVTLRYSSQSFAQPTSSIFASAA